MSSYYLCDSCKRRNRSYPCPRSVGTYACEVRGIVRDVVMHDGIERPGDLCGHYERGGQ